eukprot:bmy_02712T0
MTPTLSLGQRLERAPCGTRLSFPKLMPGQPLGWGVRRTCLGDPAQPPESLTWTRADQGPRSGPAGKVPPPPQDGEGPLESAPSLPGHTYRLLLLLGQRERGAQGHAGLRVQGADRDGRVRAARGADGGLRADRRPSAGRRAGLGPPSQWAPT